MNLQQAIASSLTLFWINKQIDFLKKPVDLLITLIFRELFKKIEVHLNKAHQIKAKRVEIERLRDSIGMWMAGMKAGKGPSFADQLANLDGTISVPLELLKWVFRFSQHTFIGLITAMVEKSGKILKLIDYWVPQGCFLRPKI